MKRLWCMIIMLFAILAIPTSVFATPLLTFEYVNNGSTEINNLDEFARVGDFSEVFHNNTGMLFTDFHFWFVNLDGDATGDGDGLFENVESHRFGSSMQFQELDFYMGNTGTGIPDCTYFRITATGFDNIGPGGGQTTINMHPTIPEPATMLLLGSGIIGLAGFKKKFRIKTKKLVC